MSHLVAASLAQAYQWQENVPITQKMQDHVDAVNKANREGNMDYADELYSWLKGYIDCLLEYDMLTSSQYVGYIKATPDWLQKKYDHRFRK